MPRFVLIVMFFGPYLYRGRFVTLLASCLDLPYILLVDDFMRIADDVPLYGDLKAFGG